MRRVSFDLYAILAAAAAAPLALGLWRHTFPGSWTLALAAWGIPIVHGYVVPAVGANVLKVWEWRAAGQWKRIRVHHGLVFGGVTALAAWTVRPGGVRSFGGALVFGTLLGLVLTGLNFVYDAAAIRSGALRVYNEPWARGASPGRIAWDYAPWFFGLFGVLYGTGVGLMEYGLERGRLDGPALILFALATLVSGIALPVAGYRWRSRRLYGHTGCRPVAPRAA